VRIGEHTVDDRVAAAVVIGLAVVSRLPTLGSALLESHPWRQTQTAFTATIYAEQGIDLLAPRVPVLGPPFVLTLEFPLYQAVAALLIRAGLQVEVALRGLSLACFAGTAAILWLLLYRHVNARTALIGLFLFAFSPLAVLWSRTSMIEYPAALGAVLFMYAALEWHAGRGRRWFLVAAVAGSVAALIKITTAVFWVAPALLLRRWMAIVLCAIPAASGAAWMLYAQAERAGLPPEADLNGPDFLEWTLGGDRLDPISWLIMLAPLIYPAGLMLAPLALLAVHRAERLVWAWFSVALIGPLLLFTNLHIIHDYYAVGLSPALAALIAGGLDLLIDRAGTRRRHVAAGSLALATAAFVGMTGYWIPAYRADDPQAVLPGAAVLRAATADGEFVELGCDTWHPAIMFYADRWGYAMTGDGAFTVVADPRVCVLGDKDTDGQPVGMFPDE
jgi:hypothetical protein